MPFNRPSPPAIRARVAAQIEAALAGADARTRRSVEGVVASMMAVIANELNAYMDWVALQVLPDTAESAWLDRHAGIRGLARRPAAAATGTVTLGGTAASVLPAGAQMQRTDGTVYTTTAAATLTANGTATVAVTAAVAAAAGDCPAGTVLTLLSPVAGIAMTAAVAADSNGNGLTGGSDIEADSALRARVLQIWQQPPQGGCASDYIEWAQSVAGVGTVWVTANANGPGSVGVRFVNADGSIPNATEIAAVQAVMAAKAPVTAAVTVIAPTPVAVPFAIALNPFTATLQAAAQAQLADFFLANAAPGGTLRKSQYDLAISLAIGQAYHVVTSPAGDITMPAGSIAQLGAITWSAAP